MSDTFEESGWLETERYDDAWMAPLTTWLPRPTYPSAAFPKTPEYAEPWHYQAEALRAQIADLQEQLDEVEEREIIYVDNPDFDQAVCDEYFPRVITIGQSYRPDLSSDIPSVHFDGFD